MARQTIKRWISIIFDRPSAKKVEGELAASMGAAGKKGGENFLREARAALDRKLADLKVALAKGLISAPEFKKQADLAARAFNTSIISGMEKARKAGALTDSEYLKLSRTLKKVGDDGSVAGGRTASAFTKAGTAIAGFLAARFGIQQFAKFLSDSIHNAIEAEDSITRLDSVLRPLGLSYRAVSGDVERYLDRLQKTTRFSDEDGREALVNLVTATGDYQLSLRLLDVTAKIAEKRHTTMAEAAQTAADASRGLTKGMKDLGISAKDTGDIVGKINTNLGNLAEEGAKKGSGAIAQMNNLWDEFKEKIGDAILGSDGLKDSIGPKGLLGALISLNEWADKNSKAISGFVNGLVAAGKAVAKLSEFIVKHTPNLYTAAKAWDFLRGKQRGLFDDVVSGESTTADAVKQGGDRRRELTNEEQAAREKRQREMVAELERTEREIAVKTLMIQKGLTEELAREEVRRREIRSPRPEGGTATQPQLEDAWKRLGKANLMLAAGLDQELTPAVSRTEAAVLDVKSAFESLDGIGFTQPASAFETAWTGALDGIRAQIDAAAPLWQQLGQAWAEGGVLGLAKLAKEKVLENIARALEMGARAVVAAVTGDPRAGGYAASAAGHAAAVVAWKAVGGVAGGGGASAASSTGGVGSSAPNLSRTENMQPPGPEVHIHFKGSSFFLPEVQKQIYASQLEAREKYGPNTKIIVHRGP